MFPRQILAELRLTSTLIIIIKGKLNHYFIRRLKFNSLFFIRFSNVYFCRKPPFSSYHISWWGKIFGKTRFSHNHGESASCVTLRKKETSSPENLPTRFICEANSRLGKLAHCKMPCITIGCWILKIPHNCFDTNLNHMN